MNGRPRILDLFAGAGGSARGYQLAGFHVTGVDIKPQPNYAGNEFKQDDALALMSTWIDSCRGWWDVPPFDAIHASPPCQAYSLAGNIWKGRLPDERHADLVGATRELLVATGLPYVIENVPGAPLREPATICGLSVGLNVKRHREFETNWPLMVPPCRDHDADFIMVFGGGARRRAKQIGRTVNDGPILRRGTASIAEARAAMGIDWMTRDELSQAIPPAMTELIGHQLMQHVQRQAA